MATESLAHNVAGLFTVKLATGKLPFTVNDCKMVSLQPNALVTINCTLSYIPTAV